jgi:hypothetical protein
MNIYAPEIHRTFCEIPVLTGEGTETVVFAHVRLSKRQLEQDQDDHGRWDRQ